MIKFVLLKIIRFFYRLLSKIIYFLMPTVSKILIALRLNSRIINQLNKLRYESHKTEDHRNFISNAQSALFRYSAYQNKTGSIHSLMSGYFTTLGKTEVLLPVAVQKQLIFSDVPLVVKVECASSL